MEQDKKTAEAIIRRSAARLSKINGFRAVNLSTRRVLIDEDGDGRHDEETTDTGAGEEIGILELRVPLFEGLEPKDVGEVFSASELHDDNWFTFSEKDLAENDFGSSREVVEFVLAEVRQIREVAGS